MPSPSPLPQISILQVFEALRDRDGSDAGEYVLDSTAIPPSLRGALPNADALEQFFAPYMGDDPDDLPVQIDELANDGYEWRVKREEKKTKTKYMFKMYKAPSGAYLKIIEKLFFDHYREGEREVHFRRDEIIAAAASLEVSLPKNLGDIIYSFRYRRPLPKAVRATEPTGFDWIIRGTGDGTYKFRLSKINRIVPDESAIAIKIPDATPQLIVRYAKKGDEQELLARIRYNRLVDIFLGITATSLQSHLRTKVKDIGQIEIDEFYVGLDSNGCHYVVPVQAKTGSDKLAVVQTEQDIAYCSEKFPKAIAKAVSAQFLSSTKIAMFELGIQDEEVRKVDQCLYELVDSSEISEADLQSFREWSTTRGARRRPI